MFGTASLGSRATLRESRAILRSALSHGFRRFDTAPLYGAGFAERLIGELAGEPIRVSTKFGGIAPPALRFLAVRLLRSQNPRDLLALREMLAQWPARQRWDDVAFANRLVGGSASKLASCAKEYLFVHSPQSFPGADRAASLASVASRFGFVLGVCGPPVHELARWLESLPPQGCVQLHFDVLSQLDDASMQLLASRPVWVHGLYSPSAHATIREVTQRESLVRGWTRDLPSFAVVLATTRVDGVERVAAFARSLEER